MNLDLAYRSFVLGVAGHPQVERLIKHRAKGLVRRYVAGEKMLSVVDVAKGY